MNTEVDRVGLVVSEAMKTSVVFARLDPDVEEHYRLRLVGIVGLINQHFGRRWSQATDFKIKQMLQVNPDPDGRHPVDALTQDLIRGGYTRGVGAKTTIERVLDVSVQMLSSHVSTLEDLRLRKQGRMLAPGEMPRGVKGGIRIRIRS